MGKRGPKPQPTILKLVRGNPGKRPLNDAEPEPPAGIPDCPDWLDAEAKGEWMRLSPMLADMGVLTRIDGAALARYCIYWSRWKAAELHLQKYGSTYPIKDDSGNIKCFAQFPQVAIAKGLGVLLSRIEAEFGMTPSSRTGVRAVPQAGKPGLMVRQRA